MTDLLGNLVTEGVEQSKDSLGSSFGVQPSGLYPATIQMAYLHTAASGAKAVALALKLENGAIVRSTEYFTNKQGSNIYEKDGVRHFLPGYEMLDQLSQLVAKGLSIGKSRLVQKGVAMWDSEAKAEVTKQAHVFEDWLNKPVLVALRQVREFKQVKDASGTYVNTTETRDKNQIDKFFHATKKLTVLEMLAGATESKFFDDWDARWSDKLDDKTNGATPTQAATGNNPVTPTATPTVAAPAVSVFD